MFSFSKTKKQLTNIVINDFLVAESAPFVS
jgi:hypothetical protein